MSKISRKPVLPSSLSSQLLNGTAAADEIQQVADYLADLTLPLHNCCLRRPRLLCRLARLQPKPLLQHPGSSPFLDIDKTARPAG
ncbi:hypothetical protein [Agrobacterium sp. V1]|uniref:hypothetical protein n=1 Tax=Agrobacterium sp. V1 TaxID=3061957 RepID=UPI002672E1ED|nr:hypothetical protein [Agrobacterium sp. V1]MDO3441380.1 hypothetical protein [Agrobacterium sp. V1]